ncbi:hypothetical protein NHX12_020525 [Muraenolepis orangiensis]|uniref:Shisa N-terminal domain-containing protein n=1 Tax=Muraenolepis orangiensis TaxID=630683 RepID=A0A9Q0IV72_9TELE|nr:hypothetical protein NHX12_020525 [Muraenolepis orangiensis]
MMSLPRGRVGGRWSSQIHVAFFVLASTVALSSPFHVCESYADSRGRSHFGFRCPRLSDNRSLQFCCYHDNTAFKYCCSQAQFHGMAIANATAGSDRLTQTDYAAVIGVWVYGSLVLVLILVDFLYYAAVHWETCGVYLVQSQRRHQSGSPPAVLRKAMAVKRLVCSGCLDPRCPQEEELQEHKPGPDRDDRHRPNT